MSIADLVKAAEVEADKARQQRELDPLYKAAKKIISIERERFYSGEGKSQYLKEIRTVIEVSSKEILNNENR